MYVMLQQQVNHFFFSFFLMGKGTIIKNVNQKEGRPQEHTRPKGKRGTVNILV